MNILSIFWFLYVVVIPFCLIILWGMLLAWDTNFSNQFGIGISLIGIFILFLFLGFCDWFGHNWHITRFTITMFVGATISVFFYCFVVIFLPAYFTYNGTTAIFMAINYIFSTTLIYLKTESVSASSHVEDQSRVLTASKERFIKLDLLVESLVEKTAFSGEKTPEKLAEVIRLTEEKNKKLFIYTKIFATFLYLGTFLAYFLVIISQNPKGRELVGLMHVILLVLSD